MSISIDLDGLEPCDRFHLAVIAFGHVDLRGVHAVHSLKVTSPSHIVKVIEQISARPERWTYFRPLMQVITPTPVWIVAALVQLPAGDILHEFCAWLESRGYRDKIGDSRSLTADRACLVLQYNLEVHYWIASSLKSNVDNSTVLRALCEYASHSRNYWFIPGDMQFVPIDLWPQLINRINQSISLGVRYLTPLIDWITRNDPAPNQYQRFRQYLLAMMIASSGPIEERFLFVKPNSRKPAAIYWRIASRLPVELKVQISQLHFIGRRDRIHKLEFNREIFCYALQWFQSLPR